MEIIVIVFVFYILAPILENNTKKKIEEYNNWKTASVEVIDYKYEWKADDGGSGHYDTYLIVKWEDNNYIIYWAYGKDTSIPNIESMIDVYIYENLPYKTQETAISGTKTMLVDDYNNEIKENNNITVFLLVVFVIAVIITIVISKRIDKKNT